MAQKRVLVADDDPDIVRALQIRLQAAGYRVETAMDGLQALDSIRREMPDLAILDINMPEGNAFQVLDSLREEGIPAMPVIFLTADTQERSQVKAFHRGIRHYITKPYDPKALLVLVEQALQRGGRQAA